MLVLLLPALLQMLDTPLSLRLSIQHYKQLEPLVLHYLYLIPVITRVDEMT